ncbi:glycosyltransferase [Sphingomonas silueang]|uniref:glycosyltransferase n=1 Tax=Sphingomonas silueang TaxID=3156617 RepID=UPI0032B53D8E
MRYAPWDENGIMNVTQFPHTTVGIVIKALNEHVHIERAIRSALHATGNMDATVVLADSGSTDGTLEIAKSFNIRIVQLADTSERSCGIGAQLGFQHLDCEYVYILDGDMELFPDFLRHGISRLAADPHLAGIAGRVEEHGEGNYEFERRKATNDGVVTGPVESLDMGGLYRTDAIRQVGYLTNRNLHSYEEKELAFRLRAEGFRLERIAEPAVRHFGKTQTTGTLLAARWRSHHLDGPGELLRAGWGTAWFLSAVRLFWRPIAVVMSWVAFAISLLVMPWIVWLPLVALMFQALLFAIFLRRTRSVTIAGVAFLNLQVVALSLARGLFRRQKPPRDNVASVVLA